MTPIIGILASSGTSSFLGSYESIQTVSVTSATQATIEFANIPSTYTHLQIRGISRDNRAVTVNSASIRFNSDNTVGNYRVHSLDGDGASASSSQSGGFLPYVANSAAASATADRFGTSVIDILDYKNTNKNKVVRSLTGVDLNGSGTLSFVSGLWMNTNAITNIQLFPLSSASFVTNTTFALYGIKG